MQLDKLNVRELKDFAQDIGLSVPQRAKTKKELIDYLTVKLPSQSEQEQGPF